MRANDLWIRGRKLGVRDSELFGLVAAQVAHQAVGGLRQPMQDLFPARVLQVERQRLLVPVQRLEEMAVVLAEEIRTDAS